MYDKHSIPGNVDESRLTLFALKQKSYDAIPPTSAFPVLHVHVLPTKRPFKVLVESPANCG